MEREVWARAGMVSTILVLVALVLVTPDLMGQPTPLSSIPVLIVAMTPDDSALLVYVTAAQPYMYAAVLLEVRAVASGNATLGNESLANAYSATVRVPDSGSTGLPANGTLLWIHARLVDQMGNLFEDNLTALVAVGSTSGLTLTFTFPSDPGTGTILKSVPDDLRWAVPRRGTIPGVV